MNDRLDQLDVVARQAADDLQNATRVHPGTGLGALYAGHTRHRSQIRIAAVAVLVAALSAGWFGRQVVTSGGAAPAVSPAPPVTSPPFPLPQHGPQGDVCRLDNVRCLGHRTYRFELVAPVRWHVPHGFGVASGNGPTTDLVESYWTHRGHPAGVSVVENVRAAATGAVPRPAPGVPATASGFVHWLAARPFLHASTPHAVTVAGHQGWQVRVRLRGGEPPGPGLCSQSFVCYPLTTDGPQITTGIWDDMVADYTAIDLPGHGTAVIWSWAFGNDTTALARNQASVDGITWPAS